MKFLLVGAGAVGCWIGMNLLQAKHQVVFVGRRAFCEAAWEHGLHAVLPDGAAWHQREIIARDNVASAATFGPFDGVIACVKTYAVAALVDELQRSVDELSGATVVALQNGLGTDELFTAAFGSERVIAGTLTSAVSLAEPNRVRLERARGGIGLAPMAGMPAKTFQSMAHGFAAAPLLRVKTFADARAVRWSKLLLNIVGNATSAISGETVANIYRDPVLAKVELRMLRECVRVADKLGVRFVNLPGAPAAWLARAVRLLPNAFLRPFMLRAFANARGDKRPSFYYDVAQHTGRSEITWLNGAIADAGANAGEPAPVNQRLSELVQALARPDGALTPVEALGKLRTEI